MPAREVAEAPTTVRDHSGAADSTHAPRISSRPAYVRPGDGDRGSLRDSATASVAGLREVRQAAHRADSRTAAATRTSVASAGNGPKVGEFTGEDAAVGQQPRNRSASR